MALYIKINITNRFQRVVGNQTKQTKGTGMRM